MGLIELTELIPGNDKLELQELHDQQISDEFANDLKMRLAIKPTINGNHFTSFVSAMWHTETKEVKEVLSKVLASEQALHERTHPNYNYGQVRRRSTRKSV